MQGNEYSTAMEEDDIMLPEGYTGAEGEDLFDEASWGSQSGEGAGEPEEGESGQAAEPPDTQQQPAEDGTQAPTTGQPVSSAGDGDGQPQPPPTTEQPGTAGAGTFRFKARVDHQDRDVEVNESDLPGLYQRAQITERAQAKEAQTASRLTMAEEAAKRAGFDGLDSLLESVTRNRQEAEVRRLTMEGVHEDVARDMAARKFAVQTPAERRTEKLEGAGDVPRRDFRGEVNELLNARPDLRGKQLPPEVVRAAAGGKPLMTALYEHEAGQARAEAQRLREENEIMRQNAANAARAPVSGTQGSGVENKPGDPFLKGFDEDY